MIQLIPGFSHRKYRWLAFSWTLVILYATLGTQTQGDSWLSSIPHIDKVIHFTLFFIWTLLLSLCYKEHRFKKFLSLSVVVLAGMLLGFITEYLQAYIPSRSSDPIDFMFDVLGVVFGLVFTFFIKKNE